MSLTSSETKTCKQCGRTKDLKKFYRCKTARGGYMNVCARCHCDNVLERRSRNIEAVRAYDRMKAKRPEVLAAQRIRVAKWAKEHKYKVVAEKTAEYAYKTGKIKKPALCERCQQRSPTEKHHPDYSRPLDIVWLCHPCHSQVHADAHRKEIA